MKKYIRSNVETDGTIRVVMYLEPLLYEDSEILATVSYDPKKHKYYTDWTHDGAINGPLSEYGEHLQPPIKHEYEGFIDDCKWLIKEVGFHVISEYRSPKSEKSEYIIVFGLGEIQCGSIIYDLRISDHYLESFDPDEKEKIKEKMIELLKINNVLDGTATSQGVEFMVEQVVVGSVRNDSWNKAFNRLYEILRRMRSKVNARNTKRSTR